MVDNRIIALFQGKDREILNIYCTAGYPKLHDTPTIIESLADAGADMIEIGMPFSDPIADGPTIQQSNQRALENGMKLEVLFEQLKYIRHKVDIPLVLMGYLNPVLQMGVERFCRQAADVGVDGLILPDLPMFEYKEVYKHIFDEHNLSNIFLISPQTSESRIREIDEVTQGFIYMVSMDSTTGRTGRIADHQRAYFERIQAMNLSNPRLIGFGIHDRETFLTAAQYAHGAIIGSAFIKSLDGCDDVVSATQQFVRKIKGS
jgi:tryptophan synthase alpha chain